MKFFAWRTLFFLAVSPLLALTSNCANQSEGERCDRDNLDVDCNPGFYCKRVYVGGNHDICCPLEAAKTTVATCNASGTPPPEGGTGTPDADGGTDAGDESRTEAGGGDAPAEASIDRTTNDTAPDTTVDTTVRDTPAETTTADSQGDTAADRISSDTTEGGTDDAPETGADVEPDVTDDAPDDTLVPDVVIPIDAHDAADAPGADAQG